VQAFWPAHPERAHRSLRNSFLRLLIGRAREIAGVINSRQEY